LDPEGNFWKKRENGKGKREKGKGKREKGKGKREGKARQAKARQGKVPNKPGQSLEMREMHIQILSFGASENNLTQNICIPSNHVSISFSFRFYKDVEKSCFHLSAKYLGISERLEKSFPTLFH